MRNKIISTLMAFAAMVAFVMGASPAQAETLGRIDPSGSQVYNECTSVGYITVRGTVGNGGSAQYNVNPCGFRGGDAYPSWYFRAFLLTAGFCSSYTYLGSSSSVTRNGNYQPGWVEANARGFQTKVKITRC